MLFPSNYQLGIEITQGAARVVRAKPTRAGVQLLAAVESRKLATALSKLPRSARTHFGVLALPSSQTFTRMIHVEETEFANLERTVSAEAQRHLPFPMDQINNDWAIVRQENVRRDIQISAVEREVVDRYEEQLQAAHVTALSVEPESLAIARVLFSPREVLNGEWLCADLRDDRLLLMMIHGGGVHSALSHKDWGLSSVLTRLEHATTEHRVDVWKKLLTEGLAAGHGKHARAFVAEFERFEELLRGGMEYFSDQYHQKPKVVVSGSLRLFGGITDQIQKLLSQPCESRSASRRVKAHSPLAARLDTEPQWDVALGSALVVVDL